LTARPAAGLHAIADRSSISRDCQAARPREKLYKRYRAAIRIALINAVLFLAGAASALSCPDVTRR